MSGSRVRIAGLGILAGVLLGAVGDASAQSFRRAGLHTDWNWTPSSWDESRVDSCFGHCGAGCGGFLSVCYNERHQWVRTIDGPVQSHGPLTGTECRFEGMVPADWPGGYLEGVEYRFTIVRYTAPGRWIFYGGYHSVCEEHDRACRAAGGCAGAGVGANLLGLFGGLSCRARPETWSYSETFTRWRTTDMHLLGSACEVYVGSTSG